MKKMLLLPILLLSLVFISCSDNDEDKGGQGLESTVWKFYEKTENYELDYVYSFHKNTFNLEQKEVYYGDTRTFKESGTYTYDHPNVTLKIDNEEITVVISNNKFTIDKDIYVKQ